MRKHVSHANDIMSMGRIDLNCKWMQLDHNFSVFPSPLDPQAFSVSTEKQKDKRKLKIFREAIDISMKSCYLLVGWEISVLCLEGCYSGQPCDVLFLMVDTLEISSFSFLS